MSTILFGLYMLAAFMGGVLVGLLAKAAGLAKLLAKKMSEKQA